MPAPAREKTPPRPLHDLAAAIGFLTLLPVGRTWPDGRVPRSVGWYPWVGWLLGALVAAPLLAITRFAGTIDGTRTFVAAACVTAAWALLTRFLHWDGLADTFDGLWGGHTPERRLEIMRDSRIGSFGAMAVVMIALLQVTALAALVERGSWWVLIAAPVVGRLAAAQAAWALPAARTEGLGLTAMEEPGAYDRTVAAAAGLALLALLALGPPLNAFIAVMAVGFIAATMVPRLLARPVGGMTGDLFGATVILVETAVLVMGAVIL